MVKFAAKGVKTPSKKTLIIAGVVFLSLILFTALVPVRQKSANDIFVLTPTETIEYGYTTLTGTIRKDSPAGENGFYFLVLSDSRSIMLNMPGYDHYIDKNVTITGYLTPPLEEGESPLLLVESIK